MRRGHWQDWPEPSRPIAVTGGVRAKSGRGAFAKNWWGHEFLAALAALDPYDGPSRLQRGRSYARRGQVLNVDIASGRVDSRVQGSRVRPYSIAIRFAAIPDAAWRRAAEALAAESAALSALLSGTFTPEAAAAFAATGAPLFPASKRDLETTCSCPDWANPCKHVAAVYYLVAEELDRDPLMLLILRGIERDAFLAACVEAAGGVEEEEPATAASGGGGSAPAIAEPLPADPAAFWGSAAPMPALRAVPALADAPLVRGLGEVPFWRGEEAIAAFAARVLGRAAEAAGGWLAGDEGSDES